MQKQKELRRLIAINDSKPLPVTRFTLEQINELNRQLNPEHYTERKVLNTTPIVKPIVPKQETRGKYVRTKKEQPIKEKGKPGPSKGFVRSPEATAKAQETMRLKRERGEIKSTKGRPYYGGGPKKGSKRATTK